LRNNSSVAQAPKWNRDQTVMSYVGKKVNSRKIQPIKITHHIHGVLAEPQKNKSKML